MKFSNWKKKIDMKKSLTSLLVLMACSILAGAQTRWETEIQKNVLDYYNSGKFSNIYALLNEEFRRQSSEDQLTGFLEFNLMFYFGKIKSAEYVRKENHAAVYLTRFEKGILEMYLTLDADSKIAGIRFLPPKPPAVKKDTTKVILSNNKLLTHTDSIVDQVVKNYLSEHKYIGYSISLYKAGKTTYYGYGEKQKNKNQIPDEETIFEIGSVTKTFTALLLAQAIQSGLAGADDDIRKYLNASFPNLELNGKPITLKQLANHTSGIPRLPGDLENQPDYTPTDPYKNYSKKMLLDFLRQFKPEREPGKVAEYSNLGIAVLGMLLENIYKKSYAQLIAEHITTPNQMKSTFINIPESELKRVALGYDENGHYAPAWHLGDIAPAGGISSTAKDMMVYMQANMEEKSPAYKLVHQVTFSENEKQQTAYAWVVTSLKNGTQLIWHNGQTAGASSFCGYIPETGTILVLLSNMAGGADELAIQLLKALE